MILIGLTGSIGMGKSTTSAIFQAAGVPVYDADAAVHRLYAGDAVAPVGALFPEAIINQRIDRAILSRLVLGQQKALRNLEAIVHPLVAADRKHFIECCRTAGAPAALLDIPLLFETGGDRTVDIIVVVSTTLDEQQKRVLARKDMTTEKFMAIKAKQLPDEEKRRRAHFVVDTGRGVEYARRQVDSFLRALRL